MKKFNKSAMLLLVCGLFLMGTVAGVWAYFGKTMVRENPFATARPEISIVEVFDLSDEWVPGENKQKEVQIRNEESVEMVMRFRVVASSSNAQGEPTGIPMNGTTPLFAVGWNTPYVENHFWSENGTYGDLDTWYYYKNVMKKGDSTENVINSVNFANWAGNEYQDHEVYVTVQTEMVQAVTPASSASNAAVEMGWPSYERNGDAVTWKAAAPQP